MFVLEGISDILKSLEVESRSKSFNEMTNRWLTFAEITHGEFKGEISVTSLSSDIVTPLTSDIVTALLSLPLVDLDLDLNMLPII